MDRRLPLVQLEQCSKFVKNKLTYHSGRTVSCIVFLSICFLFFVFIAAKLGEDFRSKHMLLVVHVWMIHKRLQREGKPGLLVQEALFDALWDDSSNRIHLKGIPEISVRPL